MATLPPDPQVSRRAIGAARWAIAVGVVGFGLKFAGWLATGSDAIFSDALESIVNIVASIGAFLALVYAERPPDEEHPYGHGPIEFVSALFEGVLVAVAGLVVLAHCAESVYRGSAEVTRLDLGLILVAASAVLNGIAGFALLRVGRATGSAALIGDGKHLLSDLWTTFAVIAGLVAVRITGHAWIDTAVALGVGVLLVVVGTRVAFGGLSSILGPKGSVASASQISPSADGRPPRCVKTASHLRLQGCHAMWPLCATTVSPAVVVAPTAGWIVFHFSGFFQPS